MRNWVAKHNHNRPSVHKDKRRTSRSEAKRELRKANRTGSHGHV